MENIFKKFSFLFLIFTLSIANAFAATGNELEETKDCLTPIEISSKFGNFKDGDNDTSMYKPCGGFILPVDSKFLIVATAIIDKQTFDKLEPAVTLLGGNHEEQRAFFKDHVPLQDVIVVSAMFSAFVIFIALFYIAIDSALSGVLKGVLTTLAFGLVFSQTFYLPEYSVRAWLFGVSQYNKQIYELHEIDRNIEFFNTDNKLEPALTTIDKQYKALNQMLHLGTAVDVATGNSITKSTYGSSIIVDTNGTYLGGLDIGQPTVKEFFEQNDECLAKDRVETSSNFEFNVKTWSDTGLLQYIPTDARVIDIPYRASFHNGGETHKYDCGDDAFGNEQAFMTIQSNNLDIAQNFVQGKTADLISGDTTMIENIASITSNKLFYIEEELEKVDVVFGSIQQNITGKIALAYAAAKEAQVKNDNYRNTNTYQNLVSDFENIARPVFIYSGEENFTTTEVAEVNALKLFQASFSMLFTEGSEDEVLEQHVNGWHYLKPFVEKTVRMQMAVDCAKQTKSNGNGKSTYAFREEYADRWNAMDKSSVKNKSMTDIGGGFDYACFVMEDGYMNAEYSDPAFIEENERDINARAQAIEIMMSALTKGVFNASQSNNDEMWKDAKLEYLNNIRPTLQSVVESQFGFLDMKRQMENVYSSVEEIYTYDIKVPIKELTQSQFFFNHNRFSSDVVTSEDMKNTIEARGLKSYSLATIFNADTEVKISEIDTGFSIGDIGINSLLRGFVSSGDCPIKGSNGSCKASLQELNYTSTDKIENMAIYFTAISKTIKMARYFGEGVGDIADTADNTVVGKVPGPQKLLIWMGKAMKAIAIAVDVTLGWMLDLVVGLVWLLVLAGKLARYMPLITEIVLHVYMVIYFVVPLCLLPIIPVIEVFKSAVRKFLGEQQPMNFKGTIMLIKVATIRWIVFYLAIQLLVFLNTSPVVGGAIYHMVIGAFPKNDTGIMMFFMQNITLSLVYIWAIWKTVPIVNELENQILRLMDVAAEAMFKETESFMKIITTVGLTRAYGYITQGNRFANAGVQKGSKKVGASVNKAIKAYREKQTSSTQQARAVDVDEE
ncbi:TPA: hypothetical protein ACN35C_004630 [Vibrio parahaemolyticus]